MHDDTVSKCKKTFFVSKLRYFFAINDLGPMFCGNIFKLAEDTV